jgi:hypothetical protein
MRHRLDDQTENKKLFYDLLNDELEARGQDELIIVGGDFNMHVGANSDGYEGVHGGFGVGDRNEDGRRVLELNGEVRIFQAPKLNGEVLDLFVSFVV